MYLIKRMEKVFCSILVGSLAVGVGVPALADYTENGYIQSNSTKPRFYLTDTDTSYWWRIAGDYDIPDAFTVGWFDGPTYKNSFIIERSAAENSLYIANDGNIGFGTNTPGAELHIYDPMSWNGLFFLPGQASIRLESSAYCVIGTCTSWNLNGNVATFTIEANQDNTIPFAVEFGAPTDSLVVESAGGVSSSWSGSYNAGDGLKNLMTLSANNSDATVSSDVGFALKNERGNFQWNFRTVESAQGFIATKDGSGGAEFQLKNSTNDYSQVALYLGNGASCNSSGQWLHASSRAYKDNIKELSGAEAMAAFAELQPVSYTFKKDAKKEPVLGFIAEDVPELVATEERDSLNALEIVALLTRVVQEQQEQIKEQRVRLQAQQMAILELQEFQASITGQLPVQAAGYTSPQPVVGRGIARNL